MTASERPACPDCGKSDQWGYCPNVSKTRWHIGCTRCQNAKSYPTFTAMWDAWRASFAPQVSTPAQPALFEVTT